jgi:hypothetical protein
MLGNLRLSRNLCACGLLAALEIAMIRPLFLTLTLAVMALTSISYTQAIAVENYILAACTDRDGDRCRNLEDFRWATDARCAHSTDPDCHCDYTDGGIAAQRTGDGRWTFHLRLMLVGIFCRGDCPGFEGWPTRILIAAPFLKLGV